MTNEPFEHRCIIVLPQAEVYPASDAMKLMALAVRNRDIKVPPSSPLTSSFLWDSLYQAHHPRDLSTHTTATEPPNHSEPLSENGPRPEKPLIIWDKRAERIKSSLKNELYRSVRNGQLNLWNLFCDMVKVPPSDLGDIDLWIATSNIYRSDLIRFCRTQKIKVEIDPIATQTEARETLNQYNAQSGKSSNQDVNRPPHWAHYKELALAFPSIGKTNAATLEWFKQGSSDRKRAGGFKEAQIKETGKKGRGHKTQFDIFLIAQYLLKTENLRPENIVAGLRKHLGAALDDYKDQYDELFPSDV